MGPVEQELREAARKAVLRPETAGIFCGPIAWMFIGPKERDIVREGALAIGATRFCGDAWSEAIEAAAELGL